MWSTGLRSQIGRLRVIYKGNSESHVLIPTFNTLVHRLYQDQKLDLLVISICRLLTPPAKLIQSTFEDSKFTLNLKFELSSPIPPRSALQINAMFFLSPIYVSSMLLLLSMLLVVEAAPVVRNQSSGLRLPKQPLQRPTDPVDSVVEPKPNLVKIPVMLMRERLTPSNIVFIVRPKTMYARVSGTDAHLETLALNIGSKRYQPQLSTSGQWKIQSRALHDAELGLPLGYVSVESQEGLNRFFDNMVLPGSPQSTTPLILVDYILHQVEKFPSVKEVHINLTMEGEWLPFYLNYLQQGATRENGIIKGEELTKVYLTIMAQEQFMTKELAEIMKTREYAKSLAAHGIEQK
ncbi:hypothetical protein J3R30DRAFT_3507350 [Lentinula aciculospora]|uniref:Uncharacterized protein n=1 Tax=Lentinula aciculospora TaxID=153920 RepID=A0A9W9A4F9_9AGAR|nr:hypothetical protein J3R30DRAFT_3507350 [Lentinula aciculospora]